MPLSDMTDEEIVSALQALADGNRRSQADEDRYYEILFERYSSQLYSLARYYGLRHDDANDVLQEGFIKLYRNIGRFAPDKPFKPYFLKIILNLVRDKYRQLKSRRMSDIEQYPEDILEDGGNFEETLHKRAVLDSIISKMPHDMKEVILLKIQTDMNIESIGKTLGISRRLAYYRYKKASEYLKNKTGGEL